MSINHENFREKFHSVDLYCENKCNKGLDKCQTNKCIIFDFKKNIRNIIGKN